TVTVTSATGVKTQQLVLITESYVNVTTSIKDQHCNGVSDASLDVTASGGLEPYRYSLNADPVGQEDHIFRNISPGNYKVSATDANGCTASQDVSVKELPALQLKDISTKPASCNSATNGQIILTPGGGTPPFTYSLSPDRTQSDSIFRRLDAGIYHYRISDKNNCTLEGNAEVKREWRECAVFIPTAFSPNNDGKNELFRAKVQDDISEYRIAVYGRWGQLIFESNNPDQGWDGKLQGTDMPAGSYMWVITYKDRKQQHMQQQGSVLLVR
ncbi:MAG TPA: gliding motility-associated C-terminal domain-containing protein, partial [Niastella sp.]